MNEVYDTMRSRYQRFKQYRQAFNPGGNSWYRMEGDDDKSTIYIYDAIGFFGIEAERLVKDIDNLQASEITLRINSPGGDVFDGTAIYNALKRHPAKVHTKIDGLAASMASLIALAGDDIEMSEGSFYMIHKPWSMVIGDANDFRAEAELLDKIESTAFDIYAARSTMKPDELREAINAETWFTPQEALDAGFADTISGGDKDKESMEFDLSMFAHAPVQGAERELTIRQAESALRDAGMTREQAKAVVTGGYNALNPRDAERSMQADEDAAYAVNFLSNIHFNEVNTNE